MNENVDEWLASLTDSDKEHFLREWFAASASAEPVAWRHSKTHCLFDTEEEVPLADGDEWAEPLYLAPRPIEAPAQTVASATKYTHPGCEVCACPNGVCQAERAVLLTDLAHYIGSSEEKSVCVPRRLLVKARAALSAPLNNEPK